MRCYSSLIILLLTFLTLAGCRPSSPQLRKNTQFLPLLEKNDLQAATQSILATESQSTISPASQPETPESTAMEPESGTTVLLFPLVMNPKTALDLDWKLIPKMTRASQKDGTYVFILISPSIEGESNDPIAEFERNIQASVEAEKKGFQKTIQSLPYENPGGYWMGNYQVTSGVGWSTEKIPTDYAARPASLKAAKAITDAGHPVLSIFFQIEAYMAGSSPIAHHRVVSYDLETGRLLALSDLFKPNMNYLKVLSDFAIQNLLDRTDIDPTLILTNAAPKAENFNLWNITPDGLLITFEENQVGEYPVGAQQILIPYGLISSFLDPQGPLGVYAT
jgi:hypothetical protein